MSSPFPLPMVFTAEGTADNGEYENSIGRLRDHCKAANIKTAALQISQCRADQVKALQDAGIFVVGWDRLYPGLGKDFDDRHFDGFMPQIEGPGQYDSALIALQAGVGAGKPRAIVTTYSGLELDGRWAKLAAAGVTAAFVECYAADDPVIHADLPRMLAQGTVYGIPADKLFAACGTYRGELPTAYKGLDKLGRNFALYIAEPMNDAQWTAWGKVNLTAPAPSPAPAPTGPTAEHTRAVMIAAAKAMDDEWVREGKSRRTINRTRIFVARHLLETSDSTWFTLRDGIRSLLGITP